jgi:hypothetical protein
MERHHTRNCLERWRSWLDNDHDLILDQLALRNLLNETTMENSSNDGNNDNNSFNDNNSKKRCQIVLMEQEPHLHFPSKQTMVQMSSSSVRSATTSSSTNEPPPLPTLIHIKNSKTAGQIQWSVQKKFFRHILQLSPVEESEGVLFVARGTCTVHGNASTTTTTTMSVVSTAVEHRIKVARPMIILPSKAWSQQQQQQKGNEPSI